MAKAETVWWGILGFIVGDLLAGIDVPILRVELPLIFIGGIFLLLKPRYLPLAVVLPSLLGGGVYYHFFLLREVRNFTASLGKVIEFSGVIVDEPTLSDQVISFDLKLDHPYRGKLRIIASRAEFSYGDAVKVSGAIVLDRNGSPQISFPNIQKIESHQASRIKEKLISAKRSFLEDFFRYLPREEAGFLGGLTFGAKNDFGKKLIADLRASGTTHLVAISGYNVQLITVALFGWLLKLFRRRTAFWFTSVFLLIFIIMVGSSASVIRAGIMGFILLFSRETGRIYSFEHVAVWAAFFMILFDPLIIVSPGFWLSYASLLGIVYLSPTILGLFNKEPGESDLLDLVIQTVSAGLAVAPITLLFFGSFSITSFIANILILPVIPTTTLLGFVLIGLSLISGSLAYFVAWLAHILLRYELTVIHFFARFNIPIRTNYSHVSLIVGYYLALILFITYTQEHERSN